MNDNQDFEDRVKELEREFNGNNMDTQQQQTENQADNSQENEQPHYQQNDQTQQPADAFGDTNFDLQSDDQTSTEPIEQELTENKAQPRKNKQKHEGRKNGKEISAKQITNSNMTWNIMMFIGIACFMMFFVSAFGHFALGLEFKKVSFLTVIALIFTFIPLIYFLATSFLKPARQTNYQNQSQTIAPIVNEHIEPIEANIENSTESDTNTSPLFSLDLQAEYKRLEDERKQLETERRELEEKFALKMNMDSSQIALESERRLLNERRFQIQNLLLQEGMNWNELNMLKDELENIEKELSEFEIKISKAAEKAAAQTATKESVAQDMSAVKSEGVNIPNYDVQRKEFEGELKLLKDEKLALSTEIKKVSKQLDSMSKKIELLKQKRILAQEAKESKKVEQIEKQIALLKENETQQKTFAADAKEKSLTFEAKVIDIRERMASVLTDLKSRMTGYNEMQKIYTSSMSLMKKSGPRKPKASSAAAKEKTETPETPSK